MQVKAIGAGTLLLCVLSFGASRATACQCLKLLRTTCAEYETADAVFVGRAVGGLSVSYPRVYDFFEPLITQLFEGRMTSFEVLESFKGAAAGDRVRIRQRQTACTRRFLAGRVYVVYAQPGEGGLALNICSRTELYDDWEAEIDLLREWTAQGSPQRVLGYVTREMDDLPAKRPAATEPVRAEVRIETDEGRYVMETDDAGRFDLERERVESLLSLEVRGMSVVASNVRKGDLRRQWVEHAPVTGCEAWIVVVGDE